MMACLQSSPWSGLQMLATVATYELEARNALQTFGHYDWKFSWDNRNQAPAYPISECKAFDLSRPIPTPSSTATTSSASSSSSQSSAQPQRHAYSPIAKPPKKRRIKAEVEEAAIEESMYKVQKLDEDDSDKENRVPPLKISRRRSNRSRKTSNGSDTSFSSTSSKSSAIFPTPPTSPPLDYNTLPHVPEPLAQNALEKLQELDKLPEFISYDGAEPTMNMM